MKKKTMAGKIGKLGIVLLSCLSLTACDKGENAGDLTGTPGVNSPSIAPENGGNSDTASPTDAPGDDAGGKTQAEASPTVSFEIVRSTRTKESGEESAYAEYPVFTVAGDGWESLSAAIGRINDEWKTKIETFLNDADQDMFYFYGMDTNAYITRCDADIVCIVVSRSEEVGGAHPNNYSDAYNLDAKTGSVLELSDVITVDEQLKEKIKNQLYENYPELEFDDALVVQGIADALDAGVVEWYFREGNLQIDFPEGSFGFGHAEGSLGVSLALK